MTLLASDSETFPFQPGLAVPRPVCWSYQYRRARIGPSERPFLKYADEGCDLLEQELDAGTILIYHNNPFDLTVAAEHRPALLAKVFKALEDGRIRDTQTRQNLIDIRIGRRNNIATKKKEVYRGAPWPESTPGFGEWVLADYTLAGNYEKGTHGLIGLYFGRDRSAQKGPDAHRTKYGTYAHLPFEQWPDGAVQYALDDSSDTMDVYLAQFELAKLAGGLITADDPEAPLVDEVAQNRAAFVLKLISAQGVRTDGATIDELERRCHKVREEIRTKLMEWGLFRYEGPKIDPKRKIVKDTKAIQARVEAAFEEQGLPVPKGKVTDKMAAKGIKVGNTKIDKDTLILSGDPYLEELAESGPASTVLTTFAPALRNGVEFPANTHFSPMLDNGRISTSQPNWNALPRGETLHKLIGMDVRQAVVPRPGNYLVSVDYDCAELRSHAQVGVWLAEQFGWPYPDMAKFFQETPNGDPHLELAADRLGLTRDEALAKKEAGDKEVKHLRQSSKPTNFGLPGGMGPQKLLDTARKQYGVKMTLSEARRSKAAWGKRWREMPRYLDYISSKTQNGYWDVEQFVSKRIRGKCGYSDAANTLWSGLTADGAKHALWNVARECYVDCGTALFGSRILLFVYDEIICEVPIPIAHEAALRLTEIMISSMRKYLPDIPVTASPALMTRWIKGAEAKYDAHGMLVPWDLPTA